MDNESLRSEGSFVTLNGNNNYETDQDKTVEFQDSAKDTSFINRLRENFGPPGKKRDTGVDNSTSDSESKGQEAENGKFDVCTLETTTVSGVYSFLIQD